MNKLTKYSLAAAVSIMLLGIVVYIIGFIGGGREDVKNMERNGDLDNFLRIRMLHGVNLSWADRAVDFVDVPDEPDVPDIPEVLYPDLSENFDISEIKKLDIELGGGYLYISQGSSKTTQIEVYCENSNDFRAYTKGNTFYIEGFKKWNSWGDEGCIYVTLPESFGFQESDIELGAGAIEIYGGSYGKTEIEVGAGEIICSGISAGKMEMDISAGGAEVSDIDAAEVHVDVSAGSADFSEIRVSGNIELSCDAGSIFMGLQGNEDDYNYKLECDLGSIAIGSHDYSGLSKARKIDNHASRMLEAECDMGSIEVVFLN